VTKPDVLQFETEAEAVAHAKKFLTHTPPIPAYWWEEIVSLTARDGHHRVLPSDTKLFWLSPDGGGNGGLIVVVKDYDSSGGSVHAIVSPSLVGEHKEFWWFGEKTE
jgi:hypothetical protein